MDQGSFSWKKYLSMGGLFFALIILAGIFGALQYPGPSVTEAGSSGTLIGSYDTSNKADALDLFIEGDRMFLATDNNGSPGSEFYVFSIDVPSQPTLLGSIDLGYPVNKVMAQNHYAYLATSKNTKEFSILNLNSFSTTTNPTEIGFYDLPGDRNALSVYALGKWAYVGTKNNTNSSHSNGAEFLIFNIENPAQPILLGTYEIGGDVNDIDVTGKYAYLATSNPNKEFVILDVSVASSTAALEKASYNVPGSTAGTGVWYHNGKLYGVTDNNGTTADFFIWNVPSPVIGSTPTSTFVLTNSLNLNRNNTGVELYGKYVFVSSRNPGGAVTAISLASSSPIVFSSLGAGDSVQAVGVKDSIVYMATADNTRELQVANMGANAEIQVFDRNNNGQIMTSCLGDSNTSALGTPQSWCALFIETIASSSPTSSVPWVSSNLAVPGTTSFLGGASSSRNAPYQIASATLNYSPDVVVSQFGTNDISFFMAFADSLGVPVSYYNGVEGTVANLKTLNASATLAGAEPFNALVPPRNGGGTSTWSINGDILVLMLNNRIRHEISAPRVIDFYSSVNKATDFVDQVHFNILAHTKWAHQVFQDLYLNSGY